MALQKLTKEALRKEIRSRIGVDQKKPIDVDHSVEMVVDLLWTYKEIMEICYFGVLKQNTGAFFNPAKPYINSDIINKAITAKNIRYEG